jgi:hypothetical protein
MNGDGLVEGQHLVTHQHPHGAVEEFGKNVAVATSSPSNNLQRIDEAPRSFNPCFGPFQIAFGRAVGQHEPAHGIGAILVHNIVWIDDILFGFGHFLDAAKRDRLSSATMSPPTWVTSPGESQLPSGALCLCVTIPCG